MCHIERTLPTHTGIRPEKFASALVADMEPEINELKSAFHETREALTHNLMDRMQGTSQRLQTAVEVYDKKVKSLKRVSVPAPATKKTKKPGKGK